LENVRLLEIDLKRKTAEELKLKLSQILPEYNPNQSLKNSNFIEKKAEA